ncbi:hypothetical protein [Streptomyces mirabilis]|uniref:hypothetical protein n=1 Tax=Streptomyces mirabilis TaxID=68239 RepID=UPI00369B69EA
MSNHTTGVDVVAAAKTPGVTALCGGINAVFAEGIRPVPMNWASIRFSQEELVGV